MGVVIRQSFKAFLSNSMGVFLGFLSLFIFYPLFFTPEELGLFRLLIELSAVLMAVGLMGTTYSINRYFSYFKNTENKHNGFFFYVFLTPLIGLIIVISLFLLFKAPFLQFFKNNANLLNNKVVPILLFMVFFNVWMVVFETASANFGRIAKSYFLREVIQRLGLIAIGFLYFLNVISFNTFLWFVVGVFAMVAFLNFYFLKQLTTISLKRNLEFNRNNKPLFSNMKRYTFFLFLGSLTALVLGRIDFIMLSGMKSLTTTAIYSIGFYLAMFIDLPKRGIIQILNPILSEHMKNNKLNEIESLTKKSTVSMLTIGVILFFGIWVNLDTFFYFMPKGEIYKASKYVMLIIGIGKLFELFTSVCNQVISISKYYVFTFINMAVVTAIAICGGYLLIPTYGMTGAAIATLIVMICNCIFTVVFFYVKFKFIPFDKKSYLIILTLLVVFAVSFFVNLNVHPIISSILKTSLLWIPMVVLFYKWKVSEDLNNQFKIIITKFLPALGNKL